MNQKDLIITRNEINHHVWVEVLTTGDKFHFPYTEYKTDESILKSIPKILEFLDLIDIEEDEDNERNRKIRN